MGLIHEAWLDRLFRPVCIAILYGCITQGLVGVVELVLPGWNAEYVVVLAAIAALEAQVSYAYIRPRSRELDHIWLYRTIELVLLYFVLQAVGLSAEGRARSVVGAVDLSSERIATFIIIALCWLGSTDTARDLWNLGEPPIHDVHYQSPADHLVGRFFVGAGVVLVATGYSELGTNAFSDPSHPAVSSLVLNVLIYFVVGVVLLGQIRYSALVIRWRRNEARLSGDLTQRWVRWTLVLVGLAAVVGVILPTTYTIGMLDALRIILLTAGLVGQLLTVLIAAPAGWLLSHLLASHAHHASQPPAIHHPVRLPKPRHGKGPGIDVVALLRSLLFWIVVLGLGVALVRGYVASGGKLAGSLRALLGRVGAVFALMFQAIWDRFRGSVETVRVAVRRMMPGGSPRAETASRRRVRRATTPREQVQVFYLTLVARAGREGAARKASETPREYATTVTRLVPEVRQDIGGLTEGFVEARYSAHDVGDAQVQAAKGWWARVRSALRRLRRARLP